MYNFNINTAGFVIVGMFLVTWAGAMLIWRYGNVEEKLGRPSQDLTPRPETGCLLSREALGPA